MVNRASSDCRDLQHLAHTPWVLVDAREQHLTKRLGQRRARFLRRRQQLLREERIALGALEQTIDKRCRRWRIKNPGYLLSKLDAGETRELDPCRTTGAFQLEQKRSQRVVAIQRVAAIADHQRDPLLTGRANQERHEVACRAVRPLEVLDH